jgi:hypothetical protein
MEKPPKSPKLSKVWSVPGVLEAVDLIEEFPFVFACDELIGASEKGELGEEAMKLANSDSSEALDQLLNLDEVRGRLGDLEDQWLEDLAAIAGPLIADIWGLSESAGHTVAEWVYFRVAEDRKRPYQMVLDNGGSEQPVRSPNHKSIVFKQIRENRLYLDVTDLSYTQLVDAFEHISTYRKFIGMNWAEMREGRPNSFNVEKALAVYQDKLLGMPTKNIAIKYGFKIYKGDNPAGSYPLLRRYLKEGKAVNDRLVMLEKRIQEWYKDQRKSKQTIK